VDTKALFTDSAALPEPATVAHGRIFTGKLSLSRWCSVY